MAAARRHRLHTAGAKRPNKIDHLRVEPDGGLAVLIPLEDDHCGFTALFIRHVLALGFQRRLRSR